ncbi:tRNA lysidine(34) synthetase TilS [Sphingomonas sp. R647]|uniref:tRNA lysidine(34) synthetase TilS n=1 Tax=Sphingomonas sp. R647 TaxID=2875233 RepID=UPI001CD3397C|nr:tRNA lysidine(34) synthetase TilS [Sphingomonas sp. R647]MCA1197582.1 tRNA lysidine(34) synthetase TilS [Sphingomonas sp. R647]
MSPPAVPPASAGDALTPLDPAWIERFRRDLEAALGKPFEGTLALAVSGGPDSMAMLALAQAAFPKSVVAATVDHGLRPASADEARMVADWCSTAGIPHATLKPPRRIFQANVQADARHLRYDLLGQWAIETGAHALLTAHHCDDQAETFLMRARRGSGPGGLGGIRTRWRWERHRWHNGYPKGGAAAAADVDGVTVLRPLLNWRRADLRAIVELNAIPFVDDPSNADERFDRVRMRQLLAHNPWLDPVALARSARICGESDAALAAMMDWVGRERTLASDVAERRIDMSGLPRELRRRLARDAIGYVRLIEGLTEGSWSDSANIESLLDALESGSGATHAGVQATAKGEIWHFRPAPPRRSH